MTDRASRPFDLVVYGSYGYTGQLVIQECRKRGLKTLLSGRNTSRLQEQSHASGFPSEAVDINNAAGLVQLAGKARVVLHCAGPFVRTASQMATACLAAGTHYLDITGEHSVFSKMAELNDQAVRQGIVIMPGTGFDVVPTDCMALHLKQKMPDATSLLLAFGMKPTGVSRGTAKTALMSMGNPTMVRKEGRLVEEPGENRVMEIDFGPFRAPALRISWGDIVTAWHTTRIPDISVHMAVNERFLRQMRWSMLFRRLLRPAFVQRFLSRKIDQRPAGPDDRALKEGRSFVYGRVMNGKGEKCEAWLEAGNGYALTAEMSVIISQKLSHESPLKGYHTPASAFGADLILEATGVTRRG